MGEAGAWSDAEPAAPRVPPAAAILGCLAELPFAPGKTGLVRILIGSVAASVGADRTHYHGALRGMTASSVERVVDRLLAEGYLTRSNAQTRDGREYAALGLTSLGRAGPPDWDRLVAPAAATSREQAGTAGRARAAPPGLVVGGEPDPDRFERLRAWRRQEAATAQVAPFMVFADTTLRALAALPPEGVDHETLALVPGIGAAKLTRYGDALVALLRDR
jgi:ATP-dependent DNA helicase RecQ